MRRRHAAIRIGVLLATVALASACTSQQMYGAGQGWQRNQCNRMPDADERQQCLARADATYEDYARRTGAAKAP